MGAIDLKDRTFIFTMDNNSFKGFNSSLQQEHFYENYLETQLYPKSTFKGKIIEEIDMKSNAEQVVRAKGMLEIHGVSQERIIKGTLRISKDKIHLQADFSVLLDDHLIKIPRVVNQKIAESIDVSVTADLTLDADQQWEIVEPMKRQILVIIAVVLLICPLSAQLPFVQKIRVPSAEPVFTRVIQDANGYLWLGSEMGLFRFDGHHFTQYYPAGDSIDFHITALFEDLDKVLWIGCKNGKIYRLEDEIISLFNPEEGTAAKPITDILKDFDGNLFWSTAGEGIYVHSQGKIFNINHEDGLNDDYVYDLECDHEGLIWAGTDAGIAHCRLENGRKKIENIIPASSFPDIIVRKIKEDASGNLWLGFQDGGAGYLTFDRSDFIEPVQEQDWIFGPVEDIEPSGPVSWIATSNGELLEMHQDKESGGLRKLIRKDEKFGKIHDLLEDREGNIWILAASGLYRSTGNRLQFVHSAHDIPLKNIHSVRNDATDQDRLWISNDEGLSLLDLSDGSLKKYLDNFNHLDLKIMSLYQDRYGFLWAGTFNYGVFRIQPADGTWMNITEQDGLVNNNVLSISGHNDTLWLATLGGASEIILQQNQAGKPFHISSYNRETGLVSNFIYSVYEDNNDQIWFGTDGDGISVRTKTGWKTYNENDGLTDDVIYSITGDHYGNIWIASASKGIFKFNKDKFTHFGLEEGLNSLDITGISIIQDEVLIIHEDGLDVLHIPSDRVAHYGEEIGLSGIDPDLNVISKDIDDNIWLGTAKGLIRYQPGASGSSYGPETVIEELSVYLEPRQMEKDLTLSYTENHISFKYSGLWYSNPEKVSYQVFLEGYDLGWIDTYDRQVTYSSLSPGKYTFKVRSSLDKSFRNVTEVSYSFRIREPFWLNDWFIIFLIIIISGLVYFIINIREKRLKRIEREKKERVEFEFQVLKNQVNPHFLFNSFSTLMSLIEEQPEQALQYTEKLSDFFRIILQYKDQELISLNEELSLIESYFFLVKKRFGDNINLEITLEENLKKTFIPPMTLQILIENCVKHNIISKDKPLFIRIYEDDGKIVVENNLQPKMMNEVSTGIGLENIRKRYRLISKGEMNIDKIG